MRWQRLAAVGLGLVVAVTAGQWAVAHAPGAPATSSTANVVQQAVLRQEVAATQQMNAILSSQISSTQQTVSATQTAQQAQAQVQAYRQQAAAAITRAQQLASEVQQLSAAHGGDDGGGDDRGGHDG